MLKGVSGLLELAGGGKWSSGLRLLFSAASHLATSLDVIIAVNADFIRWKYQLLKNERGFRGKKSHNRDTEERENE